MGELLAEFVSTESNVSLVDSAAFIKAPGGAPATGSHVLEAGHSWEVLHEMED
jgi:hypothetical protein